MTFNGLIVMMRNPCRYHIRSGCSSDLQHGTLIEIGTDRSSVEAAILLHGYYNAPVDQAISVHIISSISKQGMQYVQGLLEGAACVA